MASGTLTIGAISYDIIAQDQTGPGLDSSRDRFRVTLGDITGMISQYTGKVNDMAKNCAEVTSAVDKVSIAFGMQSESLLEIAKSNSDAGDSVLDMIDLENELAKAGVDTLEGMEDLVPAFDDFGDAVGKTGSEMVQSLVPAFRVFNIEMEDTPQYMGMLTEMFTTTTVSVEQYSTVISRVGPAMANMGLGMSDSIVLLEHFSEAGLTGRPLIAAFNDIVKGLTESLDEANKSYAKAGEDITGYNDKIADLTKTGSKLQESLAEVTSELNGVNEEIANGPDLSIYTDKLADLAWTGQGLSQDLASANATLADLNEEFAKGPDMEGYQQDLFALQDANISLTEKINATVKSLMSLEEQIASDNSMDDYSDKLLLLGDQGVVLRDRLDTIQDTIEKTNLALETAAPEAIEGLQKKLNELTLSYHQTEQAIRDNADAQAETTAIISSGTTPEMQKLKDQIEAMNKEMKTYNSDLADNVTQQLEIKDLIATGTTPAYEKLKDQIVEQQSKIADLTHEIAKNKDEQADVTTLLNTGTTPAYEALLEKQSSLESKIKDLTGQITDNSKAVQEQKDLVKAATDVQAAALLVINDFRTAEEKSAAAIGISVEEYRKKKAMVETATPKVKELAAADNEQWTQTEQLTAALNKNTLALSGTLKEVDPLVAGMGLLATTGVQVGSMLALLKVGFPSLGTAMSGVGTAMAAGLGAGLLLGLTGVFVLVKTGIMDKITELGASVGEWLAGSDIGAVILDAIAILTSPFTSLFEGIFAAMKGEDVAAAMLKPFEYAGDAINRILGDIRSVAYNGVANIASAFSGLGSALSGASGSITAMAVSSFSGISQAFQGMAGQVHGVFTQMMSALQTVINSTAGGFYNAGQNIITSMVNGILAAAGGIINAIKNIFSQIANLIPHSPAREGPLAELPNWGSYLAGGMPQAESTVKAGATSMVKAAADGINSPAASPVPGNAASTAAAGGGDTINIAAGAIVINGAGQNAKEIADMVIQQFSAVRKQRGIRS